MGRWQPGGQGRLGQAAIDLFTERGFENVTVAEIAARAGLTSRTFYRSFGDKQEVLFSGSGAMSETLTQAVNDVATELPPLDSVAEALAVAARLIGGDHEHSVRRRAIIVAHADLQERELIKLAGWARCLADALQSNGVDERSAVLAAETGTAVFRCAFDQWTAQPPADGLAQVVAQSFEQLRAMTTAG
jgi:AcrR family transcriptional regulator